MPQLAFSFTFYRMAFAAKLLCSNSPMRNLHRIENVVLIDMLAEHTIEFTRLFRKGLQQTKEYKNCKKHIETIIAELDKRSFIPDNKNSLLPENQQQALSK
jgi:hypothetical protein